METCLNSWSLNFKYHIRQIPPLPKVQVIGHTFNWITFYRTVSCQTYWQPEWGWALWNRKGWCGWGHRGCPLDTEDTQTQTGGHRCSPQRCVGHRRMSGWTRWRSDQWEQGDTCRGLCVDLWRYLISLTYSSLITIYMYSSGQPRVYYYVYILGWIHSELFIRFKLTDMHMCTY